jgi:hypothetical protein
MKRKMTPFYTLMGFQHHQDAVRLKMVNRRPKCR